MLGPDTVKNGATPPLAPLALAVFATQFGLGVAFPLVPHLLAPTGAGPGAVGAVFSAYGVAMVSAQLACGAAMARFGAASTLRLALTLYAFGMLGYMVSHRVEALALVRAVEGAGTGLATPAVMALVAAAAAPDARGSAMGRVLGLGGIGLLAGPLLGAWLAQQAIHAPFMLAAAIASLAALVVHLCLPPTAPAAAPGEGFAAMARAEAAALLGQLARPAFLGMAAPLMAVKLVFAALQAGVPLLAARAFGATPAETALLFALTGVTYVVVQAPAGWLADRVGARRALLAIFPLLACALAWLSTRATLEAFVPAWALASLLQTGAVTLSLKHLADRALAPAGGGGRSLGLASAAADLGMVFAPAIFLPLAAWRLEAITLGPAAALTVLVLVWLACDRPGVAPAAAARQDG